MDTFSENYLKIQILFKLIAMIEEILFIANVVNGINITTHNVDIVYFNLFK